MRTRDRIKALEDERAAIYGRSGGVLAEYEKERIAEIGTKIESLWDQWNQEQASRTAAREA